MTDYHEPLTGQIPIESAGFRLDQALAGMYPEYSRARLQQWIKQGHVSVDGVSKRPRDSVTGGEQVVIHPQQQREGSFEPENLPLNIIFEDEHVLVINKPPGLVVHPAAGHWQGTLMNALLHYSSDLETIPRAGIVHRLDKDTSGLMVVARNLIAHKSLVEQLQARTVTRQYLALVQGSLVAGGTVERPIGRHRLHRQRMAVVDGGKPAVTHYRIERRFRNYCLLRVKLETGRTHQIRVHLAHIRHPVAGDPVYGGRAKLPPQASERLLKHLREFRRQALHAESLAFEHPASKENVCWTVEPPADMQQLVDVLAADSSQTP